MSDLFLSFLANLDLLTYNHIAINSECFSNVAYIVLQQDVSILTIRNGRMDCEIHDIPSICRELSEIYINKVDNEIVKSKAFHDVVYEVAGNKLIVKSRSRLLMSIDDIPDFCEELMGIFDVYKDNRNIVICKVIDEHGKRRLQTKSRKKAG
jgi:hypothetical protein